MKNKVQNLFSISTNPLKLFEGLDVFFKGLGYALRTPKIFILCFFPLMASLIFLYFGFWWGFSYISSYLNELFLSPEPYSFWGGSALQWALSFLLKIMSGFLVILFSYLILQILYIPFCALIAESILKDKGTVKLKGFKELVFYNLRMLRVALIKALLVFAIALFLFFSSFFPLLSFLPLYFGLLVIAYDSFDYGLELYDLSFSERKDFFSRSFFYLNGHAVVLFFLSIIPGLILLTIPFSVVGASLKLGEFYETKRLSA